MENLIVEQKKGDRLTPYKKITSIRKLKKEIGLVGNTRRNLCHAEGKRMMYPGVGIKELLYDEIKARKEANQAMQRNNFSYKELMQEVCYQIL